MLLRSPAFGNTYTLNTNQLIRHTQGGELKVLYDAAWPQIESFKFEFHALKTVDKDATVNFLLDMAGEEIEIVDFENLTWRGVFKSPFQVIDIRGNACFWSVIVEFEGMIV